MTILLPQLWEELLLREQTRWHCSKHVKPSWLFHKGFVSLHSWHIELSILGLLHLSIFIDLSNSFSCAIKFFHLKRPLGYPWENLVSSVYICLFPWESFSRHTVFVKTNWGEILNPPKPFSNHPRAIPPNHSGLFLQNFLVFAKALLQGMETKTAFFNVFDWFSPWPLIRAKPFQSHSGLFLQNLPGLWQSCASGNGKKMAFFDVFDWFSPWPLIRAMPFQSHSGLVLQKFCCLCHRFASGNGKKILVAGWPGHKGTLCLVLHLWNSHTPHSLSLQETSSFPKNRQDWVFQNI